jgi:alkylation response protein AidB-like acyl-CoA dehydrogenase
MDFEYTPEQEAFRKEVREWLADNLPPELCVDDATDERIAPNREVFEKRRVWQTRLNEAHYVGLEWPKEYGGRGAPLMEQIVFDEEYGRARAPVIPGYSGVGLFGPTLMYWGTDEQKKYYLPRILSGEDVWCQGYSEPGAGSDLANVQTRAELQGDEWIVNGQKVWTSGAEWSDWCFVVCRTDPQAQPKHKGISYLLVRMDQPGVEVRPIIQMTGDSEFSEVFFSNAKAAKDDVVGPVNGGWAVAMGTLAFERGASTLGQQMLFQNELDRIIAIAKRNGTASDPLVRQRIAHAWMGLRIQRYHALRTLSGADESADLPPAASISKLFWASWHRDLGKLAMDVMGPEAELAESAPYGLSGLQRMFLFTRSDTIYAGSNQIQRNIMSERVLGLPREPR